MGKQIKVGVHVGGGVDPGYMWSVHFLSVAQDEAKGFLDDSQYEHVVDLVKCLAAERDPRRPAALDVEEVDGFYELKDKGGVLGKINLRVFFILEVGLKSVLVLSAVKKEAMGKTPKWMKVLVEHRIRRYRNGEYGSLVVTAAVVQGKEARREHK